MNISVNPISPLTKWNGKEPAKEHVEIVDSKITGLVHEKIHCEDEKKLARRKVLISRAKKPPIGLNPVDPAGWVNALMQFLIFSPRFSELFFFAPRSFCVFQEFMDQYAKDQTENREVSQADATAIVDFLSSRLQEMNLSEVFRCLFEALAPHWTLYDYLEEALRDERRPNCLLVKDRFKGKQIFTIADRICYDLHAFIELRPDENQAHFISYVKTDGLWFQCDNERIVSLRSNRLDIPLKRGVLFYYQRIGICP